MKVLLAVFFFLFVRYCFCNNRQPPNPSKLKTDLKKMQSVEVRTARRQFQLPSTQRYAPKFGDAKMTEKHGSQTSALISHVAQNGDVPMFALFVRRLGTGPWTMFDVLRGDDSIRPTCEKVVRDAGLEAETLRLNVDRYMIDKLFGSDEQTSTPPSLIVSKIKSALPQMKKLRPRDLELGYKITADGEEISSLTTLLLRDKEEAQRRAELQFIDAENRQLSLLSQMRASENSGAVRDENGTSTLKPLPATKLDLKACLSKAGEISTSNNFSGSLLAAIQDFQEFLAQCPETLFNLYLCSDGSAIMCEGGCLAASAGVFVTSFLSHDSSADTTNVHDGGNSDGDMYDDEYRTEPGALRLHISGVESVVESPFDAELVAGLAAAITALRLAFALKHAPNQVKPLGGVVILTDSKTLLRAVRTGPQGNEELARRGGEQRRILWEMLMDKLEQLDALGTPCTFQWTPGHPERKGIARESWTFQDWAIWEADKLARNDESEAQEDTGLIRASIELQDLFALSQGITRL